MPDPNDPASSAVPGPAPAIVPDERPLVDRAMLKKILIGLVLLLVVTGVLSLLFRGPLEQAAAFFVDRFGVAGLFVGVMLCDSWVFPPLTHEPLLFFAYAGGVPFWVVFGVAGAASHMGGVVGYLMGRLVGRIPRVQARFASSGVDALMKTRGVWVVAVAALTPIPFSVTTWSAGASHIAFGPFLLACSVRWLKVAIYFSLIAGGWSI